MPKIDYPEDSLIPNACERDYYLKQQLAKKPDISIVAVACKKKGDKKTTDAKEIDECPFVIKTMNMLLKDGGYNYENLYEFEREVHASQVLSNKNVPVAKVIEHWICGSVLFLVYDRYAGDLKSILFDYGTFIINDVLLDRIISIIEQVNKQGIIHADTHMSNFLYRSKLKEIDLADAKHVPQLDIVLTDFGRSGDFKTMLPLLYLVDDSALDHLTNNGIKTLIKTYDIIYLFWYIFRYYSSSIFIITENPAKAIPRKEIPFPFELLLKLVDIDDLVFFDAIANKDVQDIRWEEFFKKVTT